MLLGLVLGPRSHRANRRPKPGAGICCGEVGTPQASPPHITMKILGMRVGNSVFLPGKCVRGATFVPLLFPISTRKAVFCHPGVGGSRRGEGCSCRRDVPLGALSLVPGWAGHLLPPGSAAGLWAGRGPWDPWAPTGGHPWVSTLPSLGLSAPTATTGSQFTPEPFLAYYKTWHK